MYIPDKVKIGGHDITITQGYVFQDSDDLMAQACIHQKTIKLASGDTQPFAQSQIDENFLHEILHHVAYQATGSPNLFDDETKHKLVSQVLYQVLKDNNLVFGDNPTGKTPILLCKKEEGYICHI
jgi:hypothetical protein